MTFIYFPLVFLSLFLHPSLGQSQSVEVIEHWYHEVTGDKHEHFLWSMTPGSTTVRISSKKGHEETSLVCLPTGEVTHWQQKDANGTFLTAIRSGESLSITGKRDGNEILKRFELDEKPWYQFLSFSLRSFLADKNAQTTTFWMLRPDTLEPFLLEASKVGSETIKYLRKPLSAIKIKVAPHGFMGAFWHVHYWYRLPDFLFVMYRGTHGGPLTPETIITLDDEYRKL